MGWVGGVSAKEKMWKMRVTDLSVGEQCVVLGLYILLSCWVRV